MLELRRDDEVFVLQMDHGENRFDGPFVARLHEALDEVERSSGPAALVTTGSGKYYSNGLDLDWMSEQGREGARAHVHDVQRLFSRILGLELPTVAAVNGHAFAGGAMLALAHDLAVMRFDRGYWCLPEVDLGLPLSAGMNALITARLPRTTAHEAIVTGRRYGGSLAHEHGIVSEAVPEAEVLPRAIARGRELAGKRGPTMGKLKLELYRDVYTKLESGSAPS